MMKQEELREKLTEKRELIEKLFRAKPVMAWSVCTFIVTVASGIHDGLELNISLSILALICLIIMQSMISHSVNDIADESVDKDTNMAGTGRYKVLVSGIASRRDLYIICAISTAISLLLGIYIYLIRRIIILILLFLGLFMVALYNFEPIKLNYRPLSELTVVLPTIMLISLGVAYSAFGTVTNTIIYSAIVCAMMNILWYLFSRMQDAKPDAEHGKMTSMAYFYSKGGIQRLVIDGYGYIGWTFIAFIFCSLVLLPHIYLVSVACYWLFGGIFVYYIAKYKYVGNPTFEIVSIISSKLRRVGMYITYLHCALLSIVLLIY